MEKITQQKIIQTAEHLIMETEKPEVTLSQIATVLGITHAALYKHFKNKQDLWEAVAKDWFNKNILGNIRVNKQTYTNSKKLLHDWLWQFATAKKQAYNHDPKMFALNTHYIDNQPLALHDVLWDSYSIIDNFMDYHDPNLERAEAILSAFAVFNLATFSETWNLPNYQQRFEQIWQLIEPGI
ncbi:MAG: TetR/AcrR family transcriptional regulator [Lentilactobacillus hilgardii]|uniref:TetR/AcrR family transcriptional regulator n=1 Tax=Lentilactobacillus hilgardii TaxID=1588 RepID=UPI001CC1C633|nr:TetR/AcrR family transcriptional regulator [Lentilactobacillus hilgardii]MBZ2200912.1 TetR family transcriptional regulator [Lentilactobacillus hilgardii]MBZ2205219.1 TetR/AcrR family transcriptional regulator [Lentilactobacillus hilgardii]